MTDKKNEILEFVEHHAKAWNYEVIISGEKDCFTRVKVLYPDDINNRDSRFYFDIFRTPNSPEEIKKRLDKSFKKLTQKIIEELSCTNDKKSKLVKKWIVYKECPEMICGVNPCNCSEE